MVTQHKINNGWQSNTLPPVLFTIDQLTGYVIREGPDPRQINQVGTAFGYHQPTLPPPPRNNIPPPPPSTTPPSQNQVPGTIQVSAGSAGDAFGQSSTPSSTSDQPSVISRVTIDGRLFNGPVFDANGNRIA